MALIVIFLFASPGRNGKRERVDFAVRCRIQRGGDPSVSAVLVRRARSFKSQTGIGQNPWVKTLPENDITSSYPAGRGLRRGVGVHPI